MGVNDDPGSPAGSPSLGSNELGTVGTGGDCRSLQKSLSPPSLAGDTVVRPVIRVETDAHVVDSIDRCKSK